LGVATAASGALVIAFVIATVAVLVLMSVVVINWWSSAGTRRGDAGVRVGLHRARRSLDTTLLKQDIRRDGRHLRRELRHELEDIEDA
jgi:hypothetical protein